MHNQLITNKSTVEINTNDGHIGIYHKNELIYNGKILTLNQTLELIREHNIHYFNYFQISEEKSNEIERLGEFPDNLDNIIN